MCMISESIYSLNMEMFGEISTFKYFSFPSKNLILKNRATDVKD